MEYANSQAATELENSFNDLDFPDFPRLEAMGANKNDALSAKKPLAGVVQRTIKAVKRTSMVDTLKASDVKESISSAHQRQLGEPASSEHFINAARHESNFNFKDYKPFAAGENQNGVHEEAALKQAKIGGNKALRRRSFTLGKTFGRQVIGHDSQGPLSDSRGIIEQQPINVEESGEIYLDFPTNRSQLLEERERVRDTVAPTAAPQVQLEVDQRRPWRTSLVSHDSASTMSAGSDLSAGCALEKEPSARNQRREEGSFDLADCHDDLDDNAVRRRTHPSEHMDIANDDDQGAMLELLQAQQALGWSPDDRISSQRSIRLSSSRTRNTSQPSSPRRSLNGDPRKHFNERSERGGHRTDGMGHDQASVLLIHESLSHRSPSTRNLISDGVGSTRDEFDRRRDSGTLKSPPKQYPVSNKNNHRELNDLAPSGRSMIHEEKLSIVPKSHKSKTGPLQLDSSRRDGSVSAGENTSNDEKSDKAKRTKPPTGKWGGNNHVPVVSGQIAIGEGKWRRSSSPSRRRGDAQTTPAETITNNFDDASLSESDDSSTSDLERAILLSSRLVHAGEDILVAQGKDENVRQSNSKSQFDKHDRLTEQADNSQFFSAQSRLDGSSGDNDATLKMRSGDEHDADGVRKGSYPYKAERKTQSHVKSFRANSTEDLSNGDADALDVQRQRSRSRKGNTNEIVDASQDPGSGEPKVRSKSMDYVIDLDRSVKEPRSKGRGNGIQRRRSVGTEAIAPVVVAQPSSRQVNDERWNASSSEMRRSDSSGKGSKRNGSGTHHDYAIRRSLESCKQEIESGEETSHATLGDRRRADSRAARSNARKQDGSDSSSAVNPRESQSSIHEEEAHGAVQEQTSDRGTLGMGPKGGMANVRNKMSQEVEVTESAVTTGRTTARRESHVVSANPRDDYDLESLAPSSIGWPSRQASRPSHQSSAVSGRNARVPGDSGSAGTSSKQLSFYGQMLKGWSVRSTSEEEFKELWIRDQPGVDGTSEEVINASPSGSKGALPGAFICKHKWMLFGALLVLVVVLSVSLSLTGGSDSPKVTKVPTASPTAAPPTTASPTTASQPSGPTYEELFALSGTRANDFAGSSVSFSADGSYLAVGYKPANGDVASLGFAKVFSQSNGKWIQYGNEIVGASVADAFGSVLAISSDGQRVVIGAPSSDDEFADAGQTRVFQYLEVNSTWAQLGNTIPGSGEGARSGYAVAISGDGTRVIVGAPRFNNDLGSVIVYELDGTIWKQLGQSISGNASQELLGFSVAMTESGDIIAVGAVRASENDISFTGRVTVYAIDSEALWRPMGSNVAGEEAGDQAGQAVSISADGKRLAVGSNGADRNGSSNVGSCRVFDFLDSEWKQIGSSLKGLENGEQSGISVSLSGNGEVIACGGAKSSGTKRGIVRNFRDDGGEWVQIGNDLIGKTANASFGASVSLTDTGGFLVAGAPGEAIGGRENVGVVHIYRYTSENGTTNATEK